MGIESHTVKVKQEDWDKLSTEEHATICTMIVDRLRTKAIELGKLYEDLTTTYGAEIGSLGISVVINIDSLAFDDSNDFICMGTVAAVTHNLSHIVRDSKDFLIKAVKEVN